MSTRDFFINTVRMIDIDGGTNIPTVLHYTHEGPPFFNEGLVVGPS